MDKENELAIYQTESGAIELKTDASSETIWATQRQMAEVFRVDVKTINEHVNNIFSINELDENRTIRKFRIVQKEGDRNVERAINHYNLDMIISVGYRVNSKSATNFRKWATQTLRQYISDGYVINKSRIEQDNTAFMHAISGMQEILKPDSHLKSGLSLVSAFAETWLSLESYDKDELPTQGVTKRDIEVGSEEVYAEIEKLKSELIGKGEATDLFAQEKTVGALSGILGNVMQSFGGKEVYPTVETKAAHLLYFIVKNHVFNDGNKRTGAFVFVWFLQKTEFDIHRYISPQALVGITLLVAESDPQKKDRMIGLILQLLRKST